MATLQSVDHACLDLLVQYDTAAPLGRRPHMGRHLRRDGHRVARCRVCVSHQEGPLEYRQVRHSHDRPHVRMHGIHLARFYCCKRLGRLGIHQRGLGRCVHGLGLPALVGAVRRYGHSKRRGVPVRLLRRGIDHQDCLRRNSGLAGVCLRVLVAHRLPCLAATLREARTASKRDPARRGPLQRHARLAIAVARGAMRVCVLPDTPGSVAHHHFKRLRPGGAPGRPLRRNRFRARGSRLGVSPQSRTRFPPAVAFRVPLSGEHHRSRLSP